MPKPSIAGLGRKRPQIDVPITRLYLDSENPRLPEEAQGQSESELLNVLHKKFYLDELAESMSQNGYFDEEPLVGVPRRLPKHLAKAEPSSDEFKSFVENENTEFVVVEGNRRLATAKLLLDVGLQEKLRIRHWPSPSETVAEDLRILPVIVYRTRDEVTPYLGVRHIVGIQKWDSYAKARYVARMIEKGQTVQAVEEQIGDKQGTVVKNYVCYQVLEQAKDEFEFDITQAKEDFSLLLLAIGQGNIKRFLGLPRKLSDVNPKEPIPIEHVENLHDFIVWIFGDGKKKPVITDSRDITRYLSHVVSSPDAVDYLKQTRDLLGAYERSDGEETMLLKYLGTANSKLEGALGIAHRHKIPEVISEVEKADKTVKALLKVVKESNHD